MNAANTTLLGGGGVDGAIHRAAGPELLAECRTLGGCRPAKRKLLGDIICLRALSFTQLVPFGEEESTVSAEILANCYRNSLQLAVENEIKTIAFPAISCGAYGYPIEEAAQIALKTTREFLAIGDKIHKVTFVLWGEDIYEAYRQLL